MSTDLTATAQMIAAAAQQFYKFPSSLDSRLTAASYNGHSSSMRAEFVTENSIELRVEIFLDDAAMIADRSSNDRLSDAAWAEFQLMRSAWDKFMCHHD